MRYQSYARVTKTYHGVTFNPGDTKDVPGFINDKSFVRIKEDSNSNKSAKTSAEKSTSQSKPKQESKPQDKQISSPEKGTEKEVKVENNNQEEK